MDIAALAVAHPPTAANHNGYIRKTVHGRKQLLHRLVWAYFHGPIPCGMEIDHINGIKTDCRIDNLRAVPHHINVRNAGRRCDNTSGMAGVSRQVITGIDYWIAQWNSSDGSRRRRAFSIKKLGEAEAKHLATEFRAERIAEVGGYTDRHGKD